jgi:hypothetical protein
MSSQPLSHSKAALQDDVELQTTSPEPSSENDAARHATKAPIPFFRSTLFQILIVGSCAFCAPGVSSNRNAVPTYA